MNRPLDDGAAEYYTRRLWTLLPAIYRAEDSADPYQTGPLHELVARLGASMADVRRNLDRLWDNQSIEDGDDWSIGLIGELIDAVAIDWLSPRGQRADVAHWVGRLRRRGTLDTIQAMARDLSGWETLAREGWRTVARTRHSLDGGGPVAGLADLRDELKARSAGGPFDDLPHTVDIRLPRSGRGLARTDTVILWTWRLYSLSITGSTPVRSRRPDHKAGLANLRSPRIPDLMGSEFDSLPRTTNLRQGPPESPSRNTPWAWQWPDVRVNVDEQYTADPTGRDIQLFLPPPAGADSRTTQRTARQLPAPIDSALLTASKGTPGLAPAIQVRVHLPGAPELSALDAKVDPRRGRFDLAGLPGRIPSSLSCWYSYGTPGLIGAGPYPRPQTAVAAKSEGLLTAGGAALSTALATPSGPHTLTITDSATYALRDARTPVRHLALRADPWQRPLVDLSTWFGGQGTWRVIGRSGAVLELSGLFLTGGDLILEGEFRLITIAHCTFDPGTPSRTDHKPDFGIDGRRLAPCRMLIAPGTTIRQLEINQSVLGPLRTMTDGYVESCSISQSIIQRWYTSDHRDRTAAGRAAIHLPNTAVSAIDATILGPTRAQRLRATTSILHGKVDVSDRAGTELDHTAYLDEDSGQADLESSPQLRFATGTSMFRTTRFGDPAYAQLLDVPVAGSPRRSLTNAAPDGAELGAFHSEQSAIKDRAIRTRLNQLAPVGTHVQIRHAT